MSWNVPEVQPGHEVAPEAPLAVPAAQELQTVAAGAEEKLPGTHEEHVVAPLDPWNAPGLQLAHDV